MWVWRWEKKKIDWRMRAKSILEWIKKIALLHVFVLVLCLSLSLSHKHKQTFIFIRGLCIMHLPNGVESLECFRHSIFSRWQFTFWHDKKHAANQFECTRTHTQTNKHWHIELRSKRMNAVERQKFAQHLSKFKLSALVWIISQNWKYYIISIVHT